MAASLKEAGHDLLTFYDFPSEMWKSLRTTNLIERVNEEFRRRVKNPGIVPDGGIGIGAVVRIDRFRIDPPTQDRRLLLAERGHHRIEEEVCVILANDRTGTWIAQRGDATHRTDVRSSFLGHSVKPFFCPRSTGTPGACEPVKESSTLERSH